MKSEIVQLLEGALELNEEEAKAVTECIPIKTFEKGHILLREGQVSNESYFNIQGLVRKYYLVDGEEKTTEFYIEKDAISSLQSYNLKIPSNHYLECIEDCRLAILSRDKEQELFERVPAFESICRVSVEEELGAYQDKLAQFMISSPEKRYLDLMENRPDLLQRVPQYHLASYLGVKPESLSRIRKRIAQR
ncbi:Crp/Fnr family transcriptional regulator [Flagellimonas lutimaris]|uniref:Crp/Fnr family transcriptional regulator n=1 Tax=Flagellimonas lutimaris TaxID=475082 RepID=A0A3A1N2Q8_9FLAO|nr:Crp/Fnr family transcriptional regulator [Allomuricauda lutimaris]RIV30425.1 Crp/Fnr family transcriptional regulator [Allomuricauda lutimaris]